MDAHGRGGDQEKVSFLLDHLPNSLPAYSPACAAVGFLSSKAELMMLPSSSSCLISSSSGGGDGGKSLEQDFDSLDCESEEAVEVFEEPLKPAPTRSSGSKRSRAAEVHNMSEKRRRSRINEKMRALQNLIPNSNKTDKASMLDEAIEYLKQLQLQVQILSMRNGLNLHSMYMSGALQPFQSSPLSIGFGLDNDLATNIGSFDIPNQCASSHRSTAVTPALISVADPEAPLVNSSHSHHGSFRLPVPGCEAMFAGDISEQMQLAAVQYTQNLSENERTALAAARVRQVGGQTSSSSQIGINQLGKEGGRRRRRPQELPANEETFIQHLHGLQTARTFPCADAKEEEHHDF